MKPGWMRYWASVSALLLIGWAIGASAQQSGKGAGAIKRTNELTLAGLRPGKDTPASAISKYRKPSNQGSSDAEYSWNDECRHEILFVEMGRSNTIQEIRVVSGLDWSKFECAAPARSSWKTGRNLALQDSADLVVKLYGKPDSRSPSTKDGQRLELWHYAFGWAGPDVPQVMEVFCALEKDGEPGRVVEIRLAAASL